MPNAPRWNSPSRAPTSPTRQAVSPDDAPLNASKYYNDDQLAAFVCLIAVINAFNRLSVITQLPAGDYKPGQFD
jgi:hypothetical protein